MTDDKWRDDSGTDHPQTIDAEPLEQTRSGKQLKEQADQDRDGLDESETPQKAG